MTDIWLLPRRVALNRRMDCCPACEAGGSLMLDYRRSIRNDGTISFSAVSGCRNCGLVYLDPPPKPDTLKKYYAPDGDWVNRPRNKPKAVKPPVQDGYSTFLREIDNLGRTPGRVLDIGCGEGLLLDELQARGWETIGLDPATAPSITKHAMIEVIPDKSDIDLIVLRHVIEHVPNPLDVLRQARRAIRDDGYLIVGTPTLDRLREHRKRNHCISDKHITAYTERSLTNILALAKFSVIGRFIRPQQYRCGLIAKAAHETQPVENPLQDAAVEIRETLRTMRPVIGRLPPHVYLGFDVLRHVLLKSTSAA